MELLISQKYNMRSRNDVMPNKTSFISGKSTQKISGNNNITFFVLFLSIQLAGRHEREREHKIVIQNRFVFT